MDEQREQSNTQTHTDKRKHTHTHLYASVFVRTFISILYYRAPCANPNPNQVLQEVWERGHSTILQRHRNTTVFISDIVMRHTPPEFGFSKINAKWPTVEFGCLREVHQANVDNSISTLSSQTKKSSVKKWKQMFTLIWASVINPYVTGLHDLSSAQFGPFFHICVGLMSKTETT